tara:strand:- start:1590 stop:1781 length:192 start_codon:yes stop_codon:yes gene_type:complete
MAETLGKEWRTLYASQIYAMDAFFGEDGIREDEVYIDDIYFTKFHLTMSMLAWPQNPHNHRMD